MPGTIDHLNPDGLHVNPAFSQVVVAHQPSRTVYIGMQNAIDGPTRTVVGVGDVGAQCAKTLSNIELCLAAAGATKEDVVMWTIYVLDSCDLLAGFAPFRDWWGDRPNPPANTVVGVSTLFAPDILIGIDAVAVIP
jgi:enamine deaminase RidA (YjgF/YER057c/UK114 family)